MNDPLNDLADDENDGFTAAKPSTASAGIVKLLEEEASREAKKKPRQQSKREEEWIQRLVETYGDDYGKMVRDRRLNPVQQSEGDLRRRIRKWKERGGEP